MKVSGFGSLLWAIFTPLRVVVWACLPWIDSAVLPGSLVFAFPAGASTVEG